MKKIVISLVIVLVFISLLATYLLFNANQLASHFKADIERLASNTLGHRVEIGSIDLSLLPSARFWISNIRLGSSLDSAGLQLGEVALVARILPLFSKRLEIVSLEVSKPTATLLWQNDESQIGGLHTSSVKIDPSPERNRSNISPSTKTSNETSVKVDLDKFAVKNGRLTIDILPRQPGIILENFTVNSSLISDSGNLLLPELTLATSNQIFGAINLLIKGAKFDSTKKSLETSGCQINAMGSQLNLTSSLNLESKSGQFKIHSGKIDLSSVSPVVTAFSDSFEKYKLMGFVSPNVDIHISPNQVPNLAGQVEIADLGLTSNGHNVTGGSGNISLTTVDQKLQLQSRDLNLQINGESLSLESSLTVDKTAISLTQTVISALGGSLIISGVLKLENDRHFVIDATVSSIALERAFAFINRGEHSSVVGSLKELKTNLTGRAIDNLIPSLAGQAKLSVTDGSIKGGNIGGAVLRAMNNIPFIAGKLEGKESPAGLNSNETVFQKLHGNFGIRASHLTTEDLTIVSPLYQVLAKGTIGFDTSVNLSASILFEKTFSDTLTRRIKELSHVIDSEGRLVVPIKLTGRLNDLSITPDFTSLLRSAAKGALKDKAGQLIDRALGGGGEQIKKGIEDLLGF